MVKASDFESEDCRFESCVGLFRKIVFVGGMPPFCYTTLIEAIQSSEAVQVPLPG